VFEDGRTALFVPPGDRTSLGSAVVSLIGDETLQARLSAEGLALYRAHFTMDVFAERIGAIYAGLLPRERPVPGPTWGPVTETGEDR
jgi:glycosyltransferase involved in cell wall biosynthesis